MAQFNSTDPGSWWQLDGHCLHGLRVSRTALLDGILVVALLKGPNMRTILDWESIQAFGIG